jgi:hypothetical protein
MAATRGVLYIKWGTSVDAVLQRSINSLRAFHPDWPVHVQELPPQSTLLDKAPMIEMSPFEQTLYLDVDTVVMDNLEFGFEKAANFGVACCISEAPWARRFAALAGDTTEYNTGVLFFTRQAKPLFDRWARLAPTLDSTTYFKDGKGDLCVASFDDQASFAQAVEDADVCPYVLPLNWNLRPKFHRRIVGPVKIWHAYEDPLPGFAEYNRTQCGEQKMLRVAQIV